MNNELNLSIMVLYWLPSIRRCIFVFNQVSVQICFLICALSFFLATSLSHYVFSIVISVHLVFKTWRFHLSDRRWCHRITTRYGFHYSCTFLVLYKFHTYSSTENWHLQCRKRCTTLSWTMLLLHHSCLLLAAFNNRMASLNFINLAKEDNSSYVTIFKVHPFFAALKWIPMKYGIK